MNARFAQTPGMVSCSTLLFSVAKIRVSRRSSKIKNPIISRITFNNSRCTTQIMLLDINFKSNPITYIVPVLLSIAGLYVSGVDFASETLTTLYSYLPFLLKFIPSLLIGAASNYYLRSVQRKSWEDQEFLKAVQISLNYVDGKRGNKGAQLQFRTLDECQVDDLMNGNSEGIAKILAACDSTTIDQSFLGVFQKGEKRNVEFKHLDMFMKAVINRISVKFATGYLDYDFRIPVLEKEYWLGLTCEKPKKGQTFARKVRVMVASDGFLRSIPNFADPPKFEYPQHIARWECLQQMHKIYLADQALIGTPGRFWEKQVLRKIKIFRPLHYPFDHTNDQDQEKDKDAVRVRKGIVRSSPSPNQFRSISSRQRAGSNSAKLTLKSKSSIQFN